MEGSKDHCVIEDQHTSKTPALAVPDKKFTLEELRQYDGEATPTIYIALKGVVFDVTGSAFYGKGGGYHIIAGRDGSRILAVMKLESEYVDNPSTAGLDDKEKG